MTAEAEHRQMDECGVLLCSQQSWQRIAPPRCSGRQWMVHSFANAGRMSVDAEKLIGRLGRHRCVRNLGF
jgi:hypothetical protein